MEGIEVPEYFLCPISLQIMKDPVTAVTGITYDRESIERWLFSDKNSTCPVTNQPLSKDSDLTPNHTLRRLIQAWCTVNASNGVDRIPTPRAPIAKSGVVKLLQDLSVPRLVTNTLKVFETSAMENESNRMCIEQAGVVKHMVSLVISSTRKEQRDRAEQALGVLHVLRPPSSSEHDDTSNSILSDNFDLIESLTWVLRHASDHESATRAILLLKSMFEVGNPRTLERLKPEFFAAVVLVLHARITPQATKAALHVLLAACPWGSNRTKIVEAGAVSEILEIELMVPDKRTTELDLAVLEHLCSCADGRAQFLGHAAGIALVSKRILRVSPAADEQAVGILAAISKYSGTGEVLQEMLRVGAVSKLCMALQANCSTCAKEKARCVLRLHSDVWSNSPCISIYLLTRYPQH